MEQKSIGLSSFFNLYLSYKLTNIHKNKCYNIKKAHDSGGLTLQADHSLIGDILKCKCTNSWNMSRMFDIYIMNLVMMHTSRWASNSMLRSFSAGYSSNPRPWNSSMNVHLLPDKERSYVSCKVTHMKTKPKSLECKSTRLFCTS